MPKIIITLVDGHFNRVTAAREISEEIYETMGQRIDIPTPDASAAARIFCTDPFTIQKVLKDRIKLAEIISREITDELLNLLASKDTIMGYKKEEYHGNKV